MNTDRQEIESHRSGENDEIEGLPCGHHESFADATNWGRCSHFQCLLNRAYRLQQGTKHLEEERKLKSARATDGESHT